MSFFFIDAYESNESFLHPTSFGLLVGEDWDSTCSLKRLKREIVVPVGGKRSYKQGDLGVRLWVKTNFRCHFEGGYHPLVKWPFLGVHCRFDPHPNIISGALEKRKEYIYIYKLSQQRKVYEKCIKDGPQKT